MTRKFFLQAAFALALLSFPMSSLAENVRVYFGTYTGSKSKGIYTCLLDTETGKLSEAELAGEAKSPSFLALSPDGKFLYASIEQGGGAVGAFAVGAGGKLTPLNTQPSGGSGACHVWVDATGKNVLVANYGAGTISCLPVKPDGSLAPASVTIQHEGTGPDKGRQQKPHAHAIYTNAANNLVYACDLGTDDVFIYKFNPAKGSMVPNEPTSGRVPPGGGPRHLAFHPNGKFAFVNNEMTMTVTAFAVDAKTGGLTAIDTYPTLPEGAERKGASTAEIACHPTGKFLYVSNRGHNTLAVFAIADDGKLTPVEHESVPAVPRGFGISPDGKWLISGGQDEHKAAAYKIDSETGKLEPTGQTIDVGSPVCVIFGAAN